MERTTAPNSELERRAKVVLPELLARVPGLHVQEAISPPPERSISYPEFGTLQQRRYRPDLEIPVTLAGRGLPATVWRLYVEVASQVNARNLQSVAAYVHGEPDAMPVLFVPHLSAEGLEHCRRAGVSCADAVGNGWIALGDRVYIERVGFKADKALGKDRSLPPLSSPKTERVLRVLLNEAGAARRVWRLQPLAEAAGVSLSQAGRVKTILDGMGVTEDRSPRRREGGFCLTHPEETLLEWAGYVRARNYHAGEEHTFHAIDGVQELQQRLTRKLSAFVTDRFALSGLQAAEHYAPYALSPDFSAYVLPDEEVDLDALEEALDLDRTTSGVNVVLTLPRDPGVFYLPPDLRESARASRLNERKVPVVSPVQTYLDLQRLGSRAREAAQYLLEKYLRPRWQQEIRSDNGATD